MKFAVTDENTKVAYHVAGTGLPVLLFVHGWLGNSSWWDAQRDYFKDRFTVVTMDLPGHGQSGDFQKGWTATHYAHAIKAVADANTNSQLILVGHSMSGAYGLEASLGLPQTEAIILVDTLKDLDQAMSQAQAEELVFASYRSDFKAAVENMLPQYLFARDTPPAVKSRLTQEFLKCAGDRAVSLLEPLYKMDLPAIARQVKVPVRAINSDFTATFAAHNRKYLDDYDYVSMSGTGHYPMLERPEEFNRLLDAILRDGF